MTQEEILQYNKMCAEFLNLRRDEEVAIYKLNAYPYEYLRFDSDWNWIMEVVEAIENIEIKGQYIYSVQPRGATCEIKCSNQYSLAFDVQMPCIYEIAKSKKEAVVQAINQFLIWYNQNEIK